MKGKTKRIDLDAALQTIGSWSAYGGVWKAMRGGSGKPTPDCTAEKPCLRAGWVTFDSSTESQYEYVSYTVSDGSAVVVQGIRHPFDARLIASAPALLRFVKRIADGEASLTGLVDDAKALVKEVREPVRIPGLHDYTAGPFDDDDYPREW